MKSSFPFGVVVLAACMVFAVSVAQAELTVGDKAPELQVGKWVQGAPVRTFNTNHVYIVEFWATWCGPCVLSIPHLNALWEESKDKGVIVIGQDISDSDAAVAPFVKKMGTNMTYCVALDDKSHEEKGAILVNWMKAAGQHGIPTAFIVNKEGRIAWIGYPMDLNEELLNHIISGRYDLAKAAAEYQKTHEEDEKLDELEKNLWSAMDEKKWTQAQQTLNKLLAMSSGPQKGWAATQFIILLGQKKYDEAYKLADSFTDSNPNDADLQNSLAWILVTQEGVKHPNLELAEKLAECARESTGGTNSAILDTLARVQFMSGKTNEAIGTELKATQTAPNEVKSHLKEVMADYQHGILPKESSGFR
jgi:thiol-disulfide isomerase/thioredoxin/fructose-specific component phosphotransferase system IIB-like protein